MNFKLIYHLKSIFNPIAEDKCIILVNFEKNQLENIHRQSPTAKFLLQDKFLREEKNLKVYSFYHIQDVYLGKTRLPSRIPLKKKLALYDNFYKKGYIHCEYCENALELEKTTIDHYIPLSRSGSDHFSNYKISCRECNSIKTSIHPEQDLVVFKVFKEYVLHKKRKNQRDFLTKVLNTKMSFKEFKNFVFNTKISFSAEQITFIIDKLVEYSNKDKILEMFEKNPKAGEIFCPYKVTKALDQEIEFKNFAFFKDLMSGGIQ